MNHAEPHETIEVNVSDLQTVLDAAEAHEFPDGPTPVIASGRATATQRSIDRLKRKVESQYYE